MQMIEYVFEDGQGFEIGFKAFPHLTDNESLKDSVANFCLSRGKENDFKDDIANDFDDDAYHAVFYALAQQLCDRSPNITDMKLASTALTAIEKHFKADLKQFGLFVDYVQFHIERLSLKNDCLLY